MRTLSFSRVFRIKRVVVFVVVTLLYLFSHRIQPSSPQVQNVKDTALRLLRDTFPHLRDVDPALLHPEVLLGSLRKKKLVIAIPVVERTKRSYLVQTLKWLLAWIDPGDRDLVNIMVFIRSSNDNYVEEQIERIRESFDRDTLGQGRDSVLQILRTPERAHPDVDSIPATFNDSRRRMNWRTRQNIDNLYMLSYAYPFGDYYLQLEDDQDSQKDYLKNIFFWLRVHHDRPWIMMRFASQGFIGKLFRSQDAYRLAQAISLYYVHKPVDWILSDFLHGQFCSPEWDQARCFQEIEMRTPIFVPSQFNHVGFHSSMKGKIHRELQKEVGFFGNSKRVEKGNPPAEIITDMRSGMDFTVEDVYNYTIFFYSDPPRKGQQIKIKLEMPTRLKAILLTTGRLTEPSEIFGESVQVQLFHGQETVRQGHFTRQGRFERHLKCIPVDEILITVTEDIEHDVILTNILVIPC